MLWARRFLMSVPSHDIAVMRICSIRKGHFLKHHYDNVSRAMVEKFISSCTCQLDRKHPGKPDNVKPIILSTFNSRGQVDLINMTAYPDGAMKWILHYQDHDKMSYLHALPDKAKTVAFELLPLFLMQGALVSFAI
jgi:hypothetical protein